MSAISTIPKSISRVKALVTTPAMAIPLFGFFMTSEAIDIPSPANAAGKEISTDQKSASDTMPVIMPARAKPPPLFVGLVTGGVVVGIGVGGVGGVGVCVGACVGACVGVGVAVGSTSTI